MKNEIRELAKAGLRARKKDSMVLFAVLMLSFSLCICTVLTVAGMNNSISRNLQEMYGSWKILLDNQSEQDLEQMKTDTRYDAVGTSEVIAAVVEEKKNSFQEEEEPVIVGTIGRIDSKLIELGNLTCLDGKFPEKSGEVAMETSVLDALGYSYDLGQTVTIDIIQFIPGTKIAIDEKSVDYILCGVVKPYTKIWDIEGINLVNIIISDEEQLQLEGNSNLQIYLKGEGEINTLRDQLDAEKRLNYLGNYQAYNTKRFFPIHFIWRWQPL